MGAIGRGMGKARNGIVKGWEWKEAEWDWTSVLAG